MNLRALASSPFTYVIGFAALGAGSVVSGVAMLAGLGPALLTAGVFLLLASFYVTSGMKRG